MAVAIHDFDSECSTARVGPPAGPSRSSIFAGILLSRIGAAIALCVVGALLGCVTSAGPGEGNGRGGTTGGNSGGRSGSSGGVIDAGQAAGGAGGSGGSGQSSGGGTGGGSGGADGSAGAASMGGTGGTGGTAGAAGSGSAGTSGSAGAAGSGAGTGGGTGGASLGRGGAGGGASGAAGTAGAAGRGGAAGSGTGGTGGDDVRAAAQVLDGFAILKPCVSSFRPSGNPNNNGDCCCEELAANENQRITKQFGGTAGVTYNVKVRIAGVAERYWYAGGTLDAASRIFYSGGLPTIHSAAAPNNNLRPGQGACKIHPPETDAQFALPFAVPVEIRPSDGCYNGFNVFALTVSAPKQSYYLNYTADFDGADRQPHSVYKTDYTVTIPIAGQARLDFYTIDGDHHQVTNNGTMTVPNLKTAQPYNGNFLELTVIDVTRAN